MIGMQLSTYMTSDAQPKTLVWTDEPLRITGKDLDPLLKFIHEYNVSDITIQSGSKVIAESYGHLLHVTKRDLSNAEVSDIINNLYGPNATAILLSGRDIDTHYEFRPNRNDRLRYRVNATACYVDGHDGIQITLRTIPTSPPLLESLHLPDKIVSAIAPNNGCVYVTGATGSGKSTLLAAIIRYIAEDPDANRKILTYESPIEFVYDELITPSSIISQSEIPRHLPSFSAGVRNALRRKPRLILVGEARDEVTINAVLEAALTGHPVYTTVHSNGVSETIRRLVGTFASEDLAGKTIDIIDTMRLIIWQQLVPTVDGKQVALREYLVFDEATRDHLLSVPIERVTEETRRLLIESKNTMYDDVLEKFNSGIISKKVYDRLSRRHKADYTNIKVE